MSASDPGGTCWMLGGGGACDSRGLCQSVRGLQGRRRRAELSATGVGYRRIGQEERVGRLQCRG